MYNIKQKKINCDFNYAHLVKIITRFKDDRREDYQEE